MIDSATINDVCFCLNEEKNVVSRIQRRFYILAETLLGSFVVCDPEDRDCGPIAVASARQESASRSLSPSADRPDSNTTGSGD